METYIWLPGLIVSIVCAVVAYKIAQGKNRNAALWAILAFFFPLIGLIIIALIGPGTTPSYDRRV